MPALNAASWPAPGRARDGADHGRVRHPGRRRVELARREQRSFELRHLGERARHQGLHGRGRAGDLLGRAARDRRQLGPGLVGEVVAWRRLLHVDVDLAGRREGRSAPDLGPLAGRRVPLLEHALAALEHVAGLRRLRRSGRPRSDRPALSVEPLLARAQREALARLRHGPLHGRLHQGFPAAGLHEHRLRHLRRQIRQRARGRRPR